MSEDADDDKGEATVRRACTMPAKTLRYLEKLGKAGTHGSARVPGVMTFLIMQGIQDAMGKGIIERDDAD